MHMLVIVLFCLIHCGVGSDERERCPGHLTRDHYLKTFRDQCYLFVNDEKFWTTARNDCHNRGLGHHVVIPDEETQKFVMESLAQLKWSRKGIWIGAYDFHGPWKWVTGKPVTWSNWAHDQPGGKCLVPLLDIQCEDCANLRLADGKWHDYLCDGLLFKYTYICQFAMVKGPTLSQRNSSLTANVSSTVPAPTDQVSSTSIPARTSVRIRTGPTGSTAATVDETKFVGDPELTKQSAFGESQKVESLGESGNLGTGALVGIVLSVILALIILVIILAFLLIRRRTKRDGDEPSVVFDNITYVIRSLKPGSRPKKQRLSPNNSCSQARSEGMENHYDDLPDRRDVPKRKPKVFVRNQIENEVGKGTNSLAESDITDIKSGCYDDILDYEEPKSLGATNLGFVDDCDYLSSIKSDDTDYDDGYLAKCKGYDDIDYSAENSENEKVCKVNLSFEDNDLLKTDSVHESNLNQGQK